MDNMHNTNLLNKTKLKDNQHKQKHYDVQSIIYLYSLLCLVMRKKHLQGCHDTQLNDILYDDTLHMKCNCIYHIQHMDNTQSTNLLSKTQLTDIQHKKKPLKPLQSMKFN